MDKNNNYESANYHALRPALGLLVLCQALDELALDTDAVLVATHLTRDFWKRPAR